MSLDFETHLFLISIPKSKIIPSAAEKYSSQLFVPSLLRSGYIRFHIFNSSYDSLEVYALSVTKEHLMLGRRFVCLHTETIICDNLLLICCLALFCVFDEILVS